MSISIWINQNSFRGNVNRFDDGFQRGYQNFPVDLENVIAAGLQNVGDGANFFIAVENFAADNVERVKLAVVERHGIFPVDRQKFIRQSSRRFPIVDARKFHEKLPADMFDFLDAKNFPSD